MTEIVKRESIGTQILTTDNASSANAITVNVGIVVHAINASTNIFKVNNNNDIYAHAEWYSNRLCGV